MPISNTNPVIWTIISKIKSRRSGLLSVLIICLFISAFSVQKIKAASLTISSSDDFQQGIESGVNSSIDQGKLQLEPNGNWGTQSWRTPDKTISLGSAFATDGTDIYVFRGLTDVTFWRYKTATNSWETLKNAPRGTYAGADLTYLNGYIYAFFGGYQKTFGRYSIANDSWEILEDFPSLIWQGGSITTDGVYIYGIPGNTTQEFYRYNIDKNTWSPLTSTPASLSLGIGADLVYLNGFIYTTRGLNTTSFLRFDINSGSWNNPATEPLPNLPTPFNGNVNITTDGIDIFASRQQGTTSFYKYVTRGTTSTDDDYWETLPNSPYASQNAGVLYVPTDNLVYFFAGNATYRFWKFNPQTNTFLGPAEISGVPTTSVTTGSDMVFYNDGVTPKMYIPRGTSTLFYSYTPSTNTWAQLANTPANFSYDTKGTVANSFLYFFQGNSTVFYRYNPSSNTWTTLTPAPVSVANGAALAYPGTGDYLYAIRGNNATDFLRYSISSNSWTTLKSLPTEVIENIGSRLISDGTNIFFTGGTGQKVMYKYDINNDSWHQLADLPFSPYYGTDITYRNGKIIALAGAYSSELYEYDILLNSWRKLPSFAPYGPTEIGSWAGASIEYDSFNDSVYVTIGNSRPELLVFTPGQNPYSALGSWQSESLDLEYVTNWENFTAIDEKPADSAIIYKTRSSTDAENWSSWTEVISNTIASPPARYLQIKTELYASSLLDQTPTIDSIEVAFTSDITPPTNPSAITGSSQAVGGEELISGNPYRYTHPYFSWSNAIDAQTKTEGYYVYFGPDESTDPTDPDTGGIFQTSTTYQTNSALSSGLYYLRLATKDIAGNISTPITAFVYNYIGVSPVSNITISNSVDFSGTSNSVNTNNDRVKLTNRDGFWLEERLTLPPINLRWGGVNTVYHQETNKLYILAGVNNTSFRAYNTSTDSWEVLADTPSSVNFGGGLVAGPNDTLYATAGNGTTTSFWKYDISTNVWDESVTDAPLTIGYGSSMVFDGSQYIYISRGNNTNTFWRYDTFNDEWSTLSPIDFDAPANNYSNMVYLGADLTIDPNNKLIYATQGNYLKGFSVYDINTGNWSTLPDTPTLPYNGSSLEFDSDHNVVYYTAGAASSYLFKYDVESQDWTQLSSAPTTFLDGAGINKVGNSLYAIRGGNTTGFYKYNISKDSWLVPTQGIFSRVYENNSLLTIQSGADLLKGDGDNFYLTRGNYSDDFIRWNQITGEITKLARLPSGIYTGSSLVYRPDANEIYLVPGSNNAVNRNFYVYNIESNSWTKLINDPIPITPIGSTNSGSSLVYDGERYIYLTRGNSISFYRYDTQAPTGSRWTIMPNTPSALGTGSELLFADKYVYTLRGNNQSTFYRFDTESNGWTTLTEAPFPVSVSTDGWLTAGGDEYWYAARGGNTTELYRYSSSNESWEQLSNAPAQFNTGSSGESNGINKIFATAGLGTNSYQDGLYTYVIPTDNSSFVESGEYITQSHDLNNVYKWANLTVQQTIPQNSKLDIYTRSSSDNNQWSDWAAVSWEKVLTHSTTYKINSPVNQFLQIRFSFTSSDGVNSATLENYSINYYQDSAPPTNPQSVSPELNGFQAYSDSSKSTRLNFCTFDSCPEEITNPDEWYWNSDWYNYSNPYFEWPVAELNYGASDTATGSGVYGYYVYFGTDQSADPAIDGNLQIENSFTASNLSDDSKYYLRIRTVDEAGNISPTTWDAISYNYDTTGPSAPINVTANPSGYSSNPVFSFNWDIASSSGALISDYCYKTATNSGVYASDQCVPSSTSTISSIPQYKTGQNIFLIRSKDSAGNYSPYSQAPYFFADINNAPAPPTNLTVSPESSTINSFAFAWSKPDAFLGAEANLKYRYSVNALPTLQSSSETSLTTLKAGAYATIPGENTFYVVAQDEAGNINFDNYASVTFSANTVAPGIPTDIEIADVSVKAQSAWRLAISWDEPTNLGSGVASYKVYRSTNGSDFSFLATTSGNSFVDTKLTQQLYSYYVIACDNTGNCGAQSATVSLLPDGRYTEAAGLVSGPTVSDISTKKAKVSWSTDRNSDSRIAYGTSEGKYFETEIASSEQVSNHILELINLSPGEKYYLIAKWTDEDGNLGTSSEITFETLPPPSTQEPIAKNIGLTSALIEFVTKNAHKIKVYYGDSPAFGSLKELSSGNDESTHTVELNDLVDGIKYYYKINVFDSDGVEYEGEMHSFTTLPKPRIDGINITQIQGAAQTTLLVTWQSNTPVSSIVTYYPTDRPNLAKDSVNIALKEDNHRAILIGLEPNTPYSLLIRGKDAAGNEALSAIQQLTTAADTRPPQVVEITAEPEIIGAGEEANAQLIVSFKTDELSTSQVEYGEGTGSTYSQKTQEDSTLTNQHLVVISGLTPGKVYHLKALAKDEAGNLGESVDKVIVTPKATDSALDLVISNLVSTFSFLKSL